LVVGGWWWVVGGADEVREGVGVAVGGRVGVMISAHRVTGLLEGAKARAGGQHKAKHCMHVSRSTTYCTYTHNQATTCPTHLSAWSNLPPWNCRAAAVKGSSRSR
jgi:hypothetical protein